ncbi:hypothetical protein V7S43_003872 [Phytophthora oleae]|uniref:Uncharacterized protein n=1 Tax=Phytophthora oleae TaxID=2107226 RepID=A0ABD3G0F0_9STRA
MPAPVVAVGSIAFVGPVQVPALTEFRYVRVVRIDGSSAHVKLVDLEGDEVEDGESDDEFDPIERRVLQRRLVTDHERILWPGVFVGKPIAFVHAKGPEIDTWAFGVVKRYSMFGREARLHIRYNGGSCKIVLQRASNAIKVDWINYVLQTGAGGNCDVMNARGLLDKLDEVCRLCAKSRGGALPAKVTNTLSVPFEPGEIVPVIRPDTLTGVLVPRQHILKCAMNKKGKKGAMFTPLPETEAAEIPSTKRKVTRDPGRGTAKRAKSTDLAKDSEANTPMSMLLDEDNDDIVEV